MPRAAAFLVLAVLLPATMTGAEAPARKLRPVPFPDVKLTDTFWAPRIETNRTKTVPHNIATCESTGRISNFARAGGKEAGEFQGIYFNDSDVYKMIEGVCYTLAAHPDKDLEAKLDQIIATIGGAQWKDGYLNTYYTLVEKGKRWTDLPVKHELYCAGHLFEAAVAHYRATRKRTLLEIACRLADHIDATFGPGKKSGVPGHEEIELALVKLYEVTGEERYLKLAQYFIDERGRGTDRKLYGDYCQDHLPVREQSDIVGHAVRAMYLYSGTADVAAYSGDRGLIDAMERLWDNVAHKKMYVTGGIGPSAHNEGFTVDYDLPNESAYAETCASIGMALWNHRLFLLHGESRFVDVFEQVLYNGLLSGVGLDGEKFFYVNPLASRGRHHRQPWFDCACCPTNVVRFLPSVGGYFYAVSREGIWVNLYGASESRVTLDGGRSVRIVQETEYPWSGKVKIVLEPSEPAGFALRLRVPAWCRTPASREGPAASCAVNGKAVDVKSLDRGYLVIEKEWRKGDAVQLDLPMAIDRLETHPAVKGNAGRTALRRGPIIYCLEAADNGGRVNDLSLPRDARLEAVHVPGLLGGVTVLKGAGRRANMEDWEGKLYRPVSEPATVEVTAVPYCVWDNREPGEMVVWIPETPALAQPRPVPSVATRAKVRASHTGERDSAAAASDGILPERSSDPGIPRFTWWDHKGTSEWIEYAFSEPSEVCGAEVYWFDDSPQGGCRLPASWKLFYREGDAWKPVEGASAYGVDKDRLNVVTFRKVRTTGLRLEVQLQREASAGILEWRVTAARKGS